MENRRNFLKTYEKFISFPACDVNRFKLYAGHAFDVFFLIYTDYLRLTLSSEYKDMAEKKMKPIVDERLESLWANFPDVPDDYLQFFFSCLHGRQKGSISQSTPAATIQIDPIENDESAPSGFTNQIKIRLVKALYGKLTNVTEAADNKRKKSLVRAKKKLAKPESADKIRVLRRKIAVLLMVASEYEIKIFYTQCTDWTELNTLLYAGSQNLKYSQSMHIFDENQLWILRYLNLFSPLRTPPQTYVYLTAKDYEHELMEAVHQLMSYQTPLSRYCAAHRLGFFMRQSVDTPYKEILSCFQKLASESAAHPKLLSPRQSFLEGLDTFCVRDERNTRKVMVRYADGTYPYRDLVRIEFETALEILDKMGEEAGVEFKAHYLSLACSFFFDLLRIYHFNNEMESYLVNSSCLTTYAWEVEEELERAPLSNRAALPKPGTFIKKCTSFKLDPSLVTSLLPPTENSREWRLQMASDWFDTLEKMDEKIGGCCHVLDALSEVVKKKYLSSADVEQVKIYDSIKSWLDQRTLTDEQAVFLELLDLTFNLKKENRPLYNSLFISLCEKLERSSISSDKITEVLDLFEDHIPVIEKMPVEEFQGAYQIFLRMSSALVIRLDRDDTLVNYREKIYKFVRRGVIRKLFLPYESPHQQEVIETFNRLKNWISEDANYAMLFELVEQAFYTFHLDKTIRPRELAKRLKDFQPRLCEHIKKTKGRHYINEIHSLLAELNQTDRKMLETKIKRALQDLQGGDA